MDRPLAGRFLGRRLYERVLVVSTIAGVELEFRALEAEEMAAEDDRVVLVDFVGEVAGEVSVCVWRFDCLLFTKGIFDLVFGLVDLRDASWG